MSIRLPQLSGFASFSFLALLSLGLTVFLQQKFPAKALMLAGTRASLAHPGSLGRGMPGLNREPLWSGGRCIS